MGEKKKDKRGNLLSIVWLFLGLVVLLLLVADYKRSVIVGSPYRYNLVMAGESENGYVAFVSMDPQEKQTLGIELPATLKIKSRSVGTYKIGSLYKLGQYGGDPGSFVRRKMQGFMRVPILGFVKDEGRDGASMHRRLTRSLWSQVFSESELSYIDRLTLISRNMSYNWREVELAELVRVGAIVEEAEDYDYNQDRLTEYLETRIFDWTIGTQGTTISVVNDSGVEGLGTDVSVYLTNLGFDVVSVRSGSQDGEATIILAKEGSQESEETAKVLRLMFDWEAQEIQSMDEYRADLVVKVGKDAEELF